MTLSSYHQKYLTLPDTEISNRANEKKVELGAIFKKIQPSTSDSLLRIAVLGCGDKRFIKHHKVIFEEFLKKHVELITFDISTEHLADEDGVIQHDCTLPIPNPPYDITFAHVLLKFIETEKQWDLIKNSIEALRIGGLAIYVLDKKDYETQETRLSNDQFSVPLARWKKEIEKLGLKYLEIPVKYGLALVIQK